jgi:Iron-containing redox enzyme
LSSREFEIAKTRYISKVSFLAESTRGYTRLIERNYVVHNSVQGVDEMIKEVSTLRITDFQKYLSELFNNRKPLLTNLRGEVLMTNLSDMLFDLFDSNVTKEDFSKDRKTQQQLLQKTEEIISLSAAGSEDANLDLLRSLFLVQDEDYRYPLDKEEWIHEHPVMYQIKYHLITFWEKGWISESLLNLDEIPSSPNEFARWLKTYCNTHELFEHPLLDYLNKGDFEDFKKFFYYADAFDTPQVDMYVKSMIGLPDEKPRIEIAKNYWDEMGLGVYTQCHNVWANKFLKEIGLLTDEDLLEHFYKIPSQVLERFIVSQYVTSYKKNWKNLIGHLGATEIYDPILNVKVIQLGHKYGLTDDTLEYFIQHVKVDAIHGRDWLDKVVIPLVTEDPESRFGIARGAEMNLVAHYRCFDALLELFKNHNKVYIERR